MTRLAFEDHRRDPGAWAARLGISRAAIDVYLASEVIDLHVDSFIWTRVLGYDLGRRHGRGALGGRVYSQVDLPRVLEAQLSGAMWSITTNPLRGAAARARVFRDNIAGLHALFEAHPEQFRIVHGASEYRAARAAGLHAVLPSVQGGNAFEADLTLPGASGIVRVTLVHLTDSAFGTSSSPLHLLGGRGLSALGRECVAALNAQRVFVDLAHIDRKSFFDALAVHDRTQPLLVTHTGVSAVYPSWRNLDDEQLRRVADTGGVVGVVYHGGYLSGHALSGGPLGAVVDHLAHIVNVAGEDVAALGSDWDGAIVPPRELRSCLGLPHLVHAMLERGLSEHVVRKILGQNFLRALQALRA